MNPPETNITPRPLQPADIPLAMELKNIAGWNQTARDWTDCLKFDPEGCFVAECKGRAIGIVTSLRYGRRFGWIGMVLVHPECRRLGIGTTLLRAATRYLQECGTECVKLDATPMGRNVYVPMGFMDEYPLSRYEGVAMANGAGVAPGVQAMSPSDLADIIAFDAPLFGSERPAVLRSLSGRDSGYCFVWRDVERPGGAVALLRGVLSGTFPQTAVAARASRAYAPLPCDPLAVSRPARPRRSRTTPCARSSSRGSCSARRRAEGTIGRRDHTRTWKG
jgi:GNAT superfamily N-acetyltransferase